MSVRLGPARRWPEWATLGLGAAAAVAVGAVAMSPALDPGVQGRAVLEEQRSAAVERLRAGWSAEGEGSWRAEVPTAWFANDGLDGVGAPSGFMGSLELGADSVVGVLLGEAVRLGGLEPGGAESREALEEARGQAASERERAAVLATELRLSGRRLSAGELATLAPWEDGTGLSAAGLAVARDGLNESSREARAALGTGLLEGLDAAGVALGTGPVVLVESEGGFDWGVPAGEDRLRLALAGLDSPELDRWMLGEVSRRGLEELGLGAAALEPGYSLDAERDRLLVVCRSGAGLAVHVWSASAGVGRLGAEGLPGSDYELALEPGPNGGAPLRLAGLAVDVHVRPVDAKVALARAGSGLAARRRGLLALAAALVGLTGAAFLALRRTRHVAELRADLVANVSHELRTPIASILLLAENLESGRARERPGSASYPSRIRREAERLRGLVENLLDTSRLERGKPLDLQLDVQPVEAWFEAVAKEIGGHVRSAGLEFASTGPGEALPAVRHDPEALRRVVLNLAQNALAHASARRIELKLGRTSEREIELSVRDDGRGLSPADRRRVLQPFERGPLAEHTGTGLGLAICAEVARQHGGRLVLNEGSDDRGLVARLVLPIDAGLGQDSKGEAHNRPREGRA